jgi:hypothetical protein
MPDEISGPTFWWSMIFSENRYPLFRIMLKSRQNFMFSRVTALKS